MSKLNVKFKTLTPLWTSNAWGQCIEIRSSSIIGSLRFWFEVLCYFNGIVNDNYFDNEGKPCEKLNYKDFQKKLEDKINRKLKNDEEYNIEKLTDEILSELGISLPSRIFGCTGWRGRIKIKKIEPIEDYCFGNRLNLPYAIGIKKDNGDKNIIEWRTKNDYHQFIKEKYNGDNNNFKKDWSVWYFSDPYFYGKFEVTFETDKTIKDAVLIPLLNFIEKYGYIGGKWNIGYGRVKILNNDWDKDKTTFELSNFIKSVKNGKIEKYEDFDFNDIVENINNENSKEIGSFNDLLKIQNKILILKNQIEGNFKDIIKELIKIRALRRKGHKEDRGDNNERHQIFGYNNPTEGSKILPYIYEDKDDRKLKGGFISITGILNIKGDTNV
ncbi:CRISPR-associated RAMP protein, Cmr1 family [Methanocaldococcus vulcanius M7]|uniref:CRISPR-associated RAMP protein, Cmr1 family n=1 Tax=Methanocaldococcus vulcanius (strain ATCC 700851 / DSM 12094 / M7) TaxID=579137 RepID=C9RHU3_METVM|nr:type III-B CRISPR module RAMP protein Cmr1 [Methanocaldococcus vulcanius]ACX73145.1 CRISPR-associated RAMP protein, Cmr1 family [Methanocaldococcus vulcanius M7]